MKRLMCCVLAIIMVCMFVPVEVDASTNDNVRMIYLETGAYIVITIQESGGRASGTKSGTARYDYYGSDGVKQWTATLNGTFTYNGTSATCTSSSCSVSISNSAWYLISKSASKSGNTATGSVNMGRKILGVTTAKEAIDLTLSCDANGNLS